MVSNAISRALTFDYSSSVVPMFVLGNLTNRPPVNPPPVIEKAGDLYSEI